MLGRIPRHRATFDTFIWPRWGRPVGCRSRAQRRQLLQRRRPRRLKNLPTASFELQVDTWPWPSRFRDYVVVIEGGQSEARGLAIIAETKRVIPNKRIRVSRQHAPAFRSRRRAPAICRAEGVTILTDDTNKFFLEQALGTPRTLVGDVLAKSHKKPKVEGVLEKLVLKDEHAIARSVSHREARA